MDVGITCLRPFLNYLYEVKDMSKNLDPSVKGIGAAVESFLSIFCPPPRKPDPSDSYKRFIDPCKRRYGYVKKLPDELAGPGTGLDKYHGGRYIVKDRKQYELFIDQLSETMSDAEIAQFEEDYIYHDDIREW